VSGWGGLDSFVSVHAIEFHLFTNYAMKLFIFLIALVSISTFTFAQEEAGYIDDQGRKQGVHIDSTNYITFSTYVDDILNGAYKVTSDEGRILEEGFYKNGVPEGTWKKYYSRGKIGAILNYKNGQLNGAFKTFHFKGGLKSIENFKDGISEGDAVVYNREGEQILPVSIKQSAADTSVVNNTNLSVHLMFEQSRRKKPLLYLGEALFYGAEVYVTKDGIRLNYFQHAIIIQPQGVKLVWTSVEGKDKKENQIVPVKFEGNRVVKERTDGTFDFKYLTKKVKHNTSLGKLIVHVQMQQCDDTGSNPITIKRKEGNLMISGIGNLQFFEYDLNKDGKNEIYIISYRSCAGEVKIYKVEEQ